MIPASKQCRICKQTKPHQCFKCVRLSPDGRSHVCKVCIQAIPRLDKSAILAGRQEYVAPAPPIKLPSVYPTYKEWCASRIPTKGKRTNRMQNAGTFPQKEWQSLCRVHGQRCVKCGSVGRLTVDHVLPLSQGGTNDIHNLQPLCRSCNSLKGIQHIDYRQANK